MHANGMRGPDLFGKKRLRATTTATKSPGWQSTTSSNRTRIAMITRCGGGREEVIDDRENDGTMSAFDRWMEPFRDWDNGHFVQLSLF